MGFERHFGVQQVDGRAWEKRVKIVVYVAETGNSVGREVVNEAVGLG